MPRSESYCAQSFALWLTGRSPENSSQRFSSGMIPVRASPITGFARYKIRRFMLYADSSWRDAVYVGIFVGIFPDPTCRPSCPALPAQAILGPSLAGSPDAPNPPRPARFAQHG